MASKTTLHKNLSDISFFSREKINGKTVSNKCGRDFLYYALHYHHPLSFNSKQNNPQIMDEKRLLGIPTIPELAWTQIQFANVSKFLSAQGLRLSINKQEISNYLSFLFAILFSRQPYESAISFVETAVKNNETVGIDVSLGWFGLLDHVLFVYGFDEENFYVLDTHKVSALEYESIDSNNYYFKLPKSTVKKRWTRFGRVWYVR